MSLRKKVKPLYAFAAIVVSVLFFRTSFSLFHTQSRKINFYKTQESHQIHQILQKGPVKEALKTVHLSELLELSIDQPRNIFAFDLQRAEQLLLSSGVISSVQVTRKLPDTLEIDYEIREPIAYLTDYSNTVLDQEGVIFPLSPYFTPKILPKIYLGIEVDPFMYGKIEHEKMDLALKVYALTAALHFQKGLFVDQIDVSHIKCESLGKQEIVLTLYETLGNESYIRYLRLSKENYEEEFANFLNLKAMNLPKNLVVDLRMFPNAYLTPLDLK